MPRLTAFGCALFLAWRISAGVDVSAAMDLAQVRQAATTAPGGFLNSDERVRVTETFLQLVQVKGPSGQEQLIREELRRLLTRVGAKEIPAPAGATNAPLNLVMEIPATGVLTNQPALLLNAHMDTLARSNQERLAFDPVSGDFYHLDEGVAEKSSSFGGDDRSAVAAIVEAIRVLHEQFWSKGVAHRRIVLLFTADEERGCVGAKFLAREQPEVFAGLAVSLTMDGPIDLRSNYPADSYVLVVARTNETVEPYQRVLALTQDFCTRTKANFGRTETGLGSGDFAHFPAMANAGLHIRSPVRGWHSRERVRVQDLTGHVDLLCFLVLGWDHSLPARITPETLKSLSSSAVRH